MKRRSNASAEKGSASRRSACGSNDAESRIASASISDSTVGRPKSTPPGTAAAPPSRDATQRGAVCAARHRLQRTAAAVRDHGRAARHRLDRDDPEVLFAGKEQRARLGVELPRAARRHPAEELDAGVSLAPEPALFLSRADDAKPAAESPHASIARSTRLYGANAPTRR